MSHRKPSAVLLTLLFLGQAAAAGEAHLGANTVATGGAATALPKDNSAITASPGALALTERYDGMGIASLGPGLDYRLGVSAMDSRTGPVAFGVAYRRTQDNLPVTDADLPGWTLDGVAPTNKEDSHDVTLGLGFPIADRIASFGFNTTLLWWQRERRGSGFSANVDLGFATAPSPYFSAALTARNLLFMIDDEDMPLSGVLGLRAGDMQTVQGIVDLEYAEIYGLTARVGVDAGAGPSRWRAGYAWDGMLEQHQVSWGIGLENEAGAFEYAMRIPVTNTHNHGFSGVLHTVSIRVYPPPLEPPEPR